MQLYLGPIHLKLSFDADITPQLLPSAHFTAPLLTPSKTFNCHYSAKNIDLPADYQLLFEGQASDPDQMPYRWSVWGAAPHLLVLVADFHQPENIRKITAFLDLEKMSIRVHFERTQPNEILSIDPLLQPLGSLLLVYFAHLTGGFLLHASGVHDMDGKTRLFTAVSGTGKSTMAKLWQQKGAEIINDDRLWLHKIDKQWHALSTPMVWYAQQPLAAPVDQIFLLRQSPHNLITPLQGIKAQMRVMSNCIQHFHSREITTSHLNQVIDFTQNTPIFDCAFKPDTSIVEEIRALL